MNGRGDGARAVVFLNTLAHAGLAPALFEGVRAEVEVRAGPFDLAPMPAPEALPAEVRRRFDRGARRFIAAGGDGAVHWLANALVEALAPEARRAVVLGGVGLGSSNDFHKPFAPERMAGEIPVRVRADRAREQDLGLALLRTAPGVRRRRVFVVNASAGVTAFANDRFNRPDRLLALLKRRFVPGAILCAALEALFLDAGVRATLEMPGRPPLAVELTNIGVCKNHHFSGSFRYDRVVAPASGTFSVNVAHDMRTLEAVATLASLARGRFSGRRKTISAEVAGLKLAVERPIPIELDGEIVTADEVEFSIEAERLKVCG